MSNELALFVPCNLWYVLAPFLEVYKDTSMGSRFLLYKDLATIILSSILLWFSFMKQYCKFVVRSSVLNKTCPVN